MQAQVVVVVVLGLGGEVFVVAREQDGPLTWEWRSFVKLRCLARGWRSRAGPRSRRRLRASMYIPECHVRRGRLACEEGQHG